MRVLFVCLGNICRSPTVEGVFRDIARREFPRLTVTADSAGTANYHVGEPPDRRAIAAARRRGYDLSMLRAREVDGSDFTEFDLLLAMDGDNLAALRARAPSEATARIGLFLQYAPDARRTDVPDPYYGAADGFDLVVDLAESGARGLLSALASYSSRAGSRPRSAPPPPNEEGVEDQTT
jgi:protein-tyrosine phosphatase